MAARRTFPPCDTEQARPIVIRDQLPMGQAHRDLAEQSYLLLEPIPILILAVGSLCGEPNDEESREVLNALCRHAPSSADRQDFSRPHRWLIRFNLGAGGRRFESGHPDQNCRSEGLLCPDGWPPGLLIEAVACGCGRPSGRAWADALTGPR